MEMITYDPEVFNETWNRISNVKEDKPMKEYRVKTDELFSFSKGSTIVKADDGDGYVSNSEINMTRLPDTVVEDNPDWFEPVEQVQEGDYRKWYADRHPCRVMEIKGDKVYWKHINAENTRCAGKDFMLEHSSKLSTDEIEQGLIKEAKRRGYDKAKKWKPAYDTSVEFWTPCYEATGFEYDVDVDELYYAETCIYARGNWAIILRDHWKPVQFDKSDYYKIECNDRRIMGVSGKRINEEEAEIIANALNGML